MKRITAILMVATVLMIGIYIVSEISFFETLAITFAITFYHFAMRLFIGFLYQKKFGNNILWKSAWFKVGKAETKLYKAIKVKNWKKHIPTYESNDFDMKTKSYEQIAMAMCQAELVHETIIIFSFLPIISAIWFGAIEVFIITSIISAFVDLVFVILQRYNRPRILKMIKATDNR